MQVAPWVIWVVIAVIALSGEMFSLGLYLASFGVSAAIVAVLSLAAPLVAQIAVFLALSLALLFVARPVVLRVLPRSNDASTFPTMGPIGKDAVVVQRLTRQSGQIRVGEGEFWSARALDPNDLLPSGREVEVVEMDGLTALVRPVGVAPRGSEGSEIDPFGLSLREVEVLQLVALGLTNQEIATGLFLSPRTVHHHVSHIFDKMNVSSRTEAASVAMQRGLVKPRE